MDEAWLRRAASVGTPLVIVPGVPGYGDEHYPSSASDCARLLRESGVSVGWLDPVADRYTIALKGADLLQLPAIACFIDQLSPQLLANIRIAIDLLLALAPANRRRGAKAGFGAVYPDGSMDWLEGEAESGEDVAKMIKAFGDSKGANRSPRDQRSIR